MFWSAILHADEWHLYYNMTSLLWKGLQLEQALGSLRLFLLVCELWATSSALLCALMWLSHHLLGHVAPAIASQYYSLCAVGFSAVLFGLKAVINASETGWQSVHVPILGRVQTPPKVGCCSLASFPGTCACAPIHCKMQWSERAALWSARSAPPSLARC